MSMDPSTWVGKHLTTPDGEPLNLERFGSGLRFLSSSAFCQPSRRERILTKSMRLARRLKGSHAR